MVVPVVVPVCSAGEFPIAVPEYRVVVVAFVATFDGVPVPV